MKKTWRKKLKALTLIFGLLAAIIIGTLPFLRTVVSVDVSVMMLTVGGICFIMSMIMIVISMITDSQLLIRLAALPVTYVLVIMGYMVHQLNIYNGFKVMLGAQVPNQEHIFESTASLGKLSLLLHGGVWICLIPLVVAAVIKTRKLSKRNNIDFSTFDTTQGKITNVIDVHTKINRMKAYKISLNIPYYQGQSYEVTKEFLVPIHVIHTLAIGKEVTLKVNPEKIEEVYIESEYGII